MSKTLIPPTPGGVCESVGCGGTIVRNNVLYIGHYASRCGACDKGADPHEKSHDTALGYQTAPGCGEPFTHVTNTYIGDDEMVRAMRPDLIYIDPMEDINE